MEETGYAIRVLDLLFVRAYISNHHEFAATEPDVHQIPAYGSRKSTIVQPTSSIHTLCLSGADNPSSRNHTSSSPP
jgi:hypothetical protein